jgi:DNA-binding transcriptional LysR family regulator
MERSSTDLVDVIAFIRVVETGSFARAAERMSLSKPVLSRRVARLEEQLGARLLTRSARGAQPTDIGQTYYERAANVLAELEAAEEVVAEAATLVAGPIRITAPVTFGVGHLACALADFVRLHPKVELDVSLDDRNVDLVGGGYDLGIRIGRLRDSALVARKLAPIRAVTVASPIYLDARGRPERPRDLERHDLLHYSNVAAGEQWRFQTKKGWEVVRGTIKTRSDSGDLLCAFAVAGLGVVVLPSFIAAPSIESGALEVILIDYPLEEVALHALMPAGRASTARVRALVDFLVDRFGPEPSWDPCWMAQAGAKAPTAPGDSRSAR